jgi:arylsulfatase A-like enzyme
MKHPLLLLASLGVVCGHAAATGPGALPNIVIILADDLGYGDLSCYNKASRIPTPQLDRLAQEGLRLTDAHSPSAVCTPTRYGLLTGRYPWRSRQKSGVLGPWGVSLIEKDRLTLPAMLRANDYATHAIGKWHLGWQWPTKDGKAPGSRIDPHSNVDFARPIAEGPTTRGFDTYFGTDVPNYPPFCFIENDRTVGDPSELSNAGDFNIRGPALPGWRAVDILPELTRRAVGTLEKSARAADKQPFFLYFALTSPHYPIAPAPEFVGKSGAGKYGDFVMQTDWVVGQVTDALKRTGLAENTLVIFTSDNGPEIDDEIGVGAFERLQKFAHASMGSLRGVKRDAWEGGHRVPMIVRWPGHAPAGKVSDQFLILTDMMATCAAITGGALPNNSAEDSVNMLPALLGGKVAREAGVMVGISGKAALRQGDWVLIAAATGRENPAPRGEPDWFREQRGYTSHGEPYELFNLRDDPTQRTNRAAGEGERVKAMLALLDQYQREGRSIPMREDSHP